MSVNMFLSNVFTLFLSALFNIMGVIKISRTKTTMYDFKIQKIEQMLYSLYFKIQTLASNWNDLETISTALTQEWHIMLPLYMCVCVYILNNHMACYL